MKYRHGAWLVWKSVKSMIVADYVVSRPIMMGIGFYHDSDQNTVYLHLLNLTLSLRRTVFKIPDGKVTCSFTFVP